MSTAPDSRDTSPGADGGAAGTATAGGSGGKTRSRAGCITCRQRKKKCDETRLPQHNGACERCYLASYECEWPAPPGQRPVRAFTKGVRTAKRAAKQQANAAAAAAATGGGPAAQPAAAAGPSQPPYSFPSTVVPSSYPPAPAPVLSAPQPPPLQQQQPSFSYSSSHPLPNALAPSLGLSSTPTLLPPSSASGPMPSTSIPQFDLSDLLAPYSSIAPNQNEELSSFFASLDSEFGTWDASQIGSTPTWGESPADELPKQPAVPSSNGGHASTDAAVPPPEGATGDDGEPLDPVYNDFNADFFASLPKPVRDVVVGKIYNVATSAVSSRNAGMAMAMLYRLRQLQKQQLSTDPNEAAAAAKQQNRLLAAGNSYFQKALDHLAVSEVPFEVKILATLDLLSYQFDQFGAAACHAIHLLAEFFISDALGSQPMLQFDSINDATSIILICYAWTDVLRCLHQPKRRPVFSFPSLPGDLASSTSSVPWQPPPSIVQAHLGLPLALLLCLAAVANLSAEMDALPDEIVKAKAEAIERAIREWRPPPPDAQDLVDGSLYLEKVGTAEMWRHACIIFLHQAVYQHGPIHPAIVAAVHQILTIGTKLLHSHTATTSLIDPNVTLPSSIRPAQPKPSIDPRKNVAIASPVWRDGPWFLAGTVVTMPQDRALCKMGLEQCGNIQAYKDNIVALERIWHEQDETGWLVDWRDFLQKQRVYVEFM
ncbi:hypothetical protein JCM6882_005990 [Rhodosporidiobolus microsporus]